MNRRYNFGRYKSSRQERIANSILSSRRIRQKRYNRIRDNISDNDEDNLYDDYLRVDDVDDVSNSINYETFEDRVKRMNEEYAKKKREEDEISCATTVLIN